MAIDLSQFQQAFFEETAEHLVEMEHLLLGLDIGTPDPDELNGIFRAAHSIKGGSGIFGFNDITELTHLLESLLDKLRSGRLALRAEMIDVFLAACDVIKAQVAAVQDHSPLDPELVQTVQQALQGLTQAPSLPVATAAEAPEPEPEIALTLPVLAAAPAEDGYPAMFEVTAPAGAGSAKPSPAGGDASSIRIGVDKIDLLINLVGELVITQSMLVQSGLALDPVEHERMLVALGQLERNTRELQEAVLSIRMVPISLVFNRFPRVIRDLSARLGKQVELATRGEQTELDKGLVERIADPLIHLVRNSIDHGIETAERRLAAGKPACGTIELAASHRGGTIVIEVRDDGAGLDRERILATAAARGLAVNEGMSDQEVWQLIFMPGFSTAQTVSDISGRGVGMDVVRRNIQSLGGRIEIESDAGKGSKVTIHLPLTLAILDGMSVALGGEVFVIPLAQILESLQPRAQDVRTVAGRGRMVCVRGDYIPLLPLGEVLHIEAEVQAPEHGIVILVEADGQKAALLVDAMLGQQQVVIKSLESNYRRVAGFSGATIMGDGRVALILDVAALACLCRPAPVAGAAAWGLPLLQP